MPKWSYSEDERLGAAQSLALLALLLFDPGTYGPSEYNANAIYKEIEGKLGMYTTRSVSSNISLAVGFQLKI